MDILTGRGTDAKKLDLDHDCWWGKEGSILPGLTISQSRSSDDFQSSANPIYTSTLTSWSSPSTDAALTVVEAAGVLSVTKS